MTPTICFDTNVLWDLCTTADTNPWGSSVEAGFRYRVRAFSEFMIALKNKGLVQIKAPWFSVLEFRDLCRDNVYCGYLMFTKGRSAMELKNHRPDYQGMPDEQRQLAKGFAKSAMDQFGWISFADNLSNHSRFHQCTSDLISHGVLSLHDGCVVASAIDCGVDVFISRDGIFGNQDVQRNLRDVLRSPTLAFFNHITFEPLSSVLPIDGSSVTPQEKLREKKRNGRKNLVSALFGNAINALKERELGSVVEFSHERLGHGSHLIKYLHLSDRHSISIGARVALVGESYCRKLIVRSIQQHGVALPEPVARKQGLPPLELGLAVRMDNDSFLDPEVRGKGDVICLETANA